MRILLTADPELPVPPVGYGGIERIVDALVRTFKARGHTVGLVANRASTCPADILFGWPGRLSTSRRDSLSNALALWRARRAFRPDVLHSFSRLAYLAPLLCTRLPKVMSYQRHTGGRQIGLAARLGGTTLRFTGCSDYICRLASPAGGVWRPIPNFVEPDKYPFVASVPADAPLLFLSRVESIKGPDVAIAVARAAGRRLIIAGNRAEQGREREFWDKAVAPHLGRDGIEWVGEVGDARKRDLLAQAAALIVPIRWDEPFGIVFAEALAVGCPVISCARGAVPEIIEDGTTGFFIRTVEDGVEAVRRLAGIDRTACRRSVEDRFSASVCAGQYLELYREMLGITDNHA